MNEPSDRSGIMTKAPTQPVDLVRIAGAGGVVWSAPATGFQTNLVVLDPRASIAPHTNDVVDVLIVVLTGLATLAADHETLLLAPMSAVVIPRGANRSIAAGDDELRYLTIHAERGPLAISHREASDV